MDHGKDGKRYHESKSYEGMVFVCLCGEPFMDERELEKHVEVAQREDALAQRVADEHMESSTHGTIRTD
jgi:hypothetical protein